MHNFLSAILTWSLIQFCGNLQARNNFISSADTAVPRTYAMIMGISTYKFIRPLSYADKDAELFKDFLKSPAGGNLKDTNLYFLENEEAKMANFWIKGMDWLTKKNLQKGDKLYIYLAGHGDAIDENEFFFLTYDCNHAGDKNNYLFSGTIQLYNLKNRMRKLVQKGVDLIFIMDACRTSELPGGDNGQQILNQAITEQKVGDIMMIAASAGQESLEDATVGTGHGLFTYFLVDGLSGLADAEGTPDKKITLGELKQYVGKAVSGFATTKNRKQDPVFCCDQDDQKVIAIVDTAFMRKWVLAKKLTGHLNGNKLNSFSVRAAKISNTVPPDDSTLIELYNQFNKAIKELNLTGAAGSAESFFDQMNKIDPKNNLTQDAKLTLATEFVNFAQGKINLYLEGRDVSTIQRIRSQLDADDKSEEVTASLDRMEKVARQDFSEVADMIKKAIDYINIDDDDFLRKLKAQNFFFKAHGYLEKGGDKKGLQIAIQDAMQAYEADPKAAYILNTLSSLEIDNNKPDSAIYFATKAISIAPLWRYPYVNMANAFTRKRNPDSALVYFKKALKVDENRADAYVDLGYFYFQQRKLDSAGAYYKKALVIDPQNVPANNNMGWLLRESRELNLAIGYFRKSLQYDPRFFNAYNGISRVFTDLKMFDSARIYYQKAREAYPDKLLANSYLGQFYQDINEVDSARNYFIQAAVYDANYDAPFINLGKLYAQVKQYDSAKFYYRKALDLNTKNFRGYNQLGMLYNDLKEFDSAKYYYKKGLDLNPDNTIVMNNFGLLFYAQNSLDSAATYFKKVISLSPENAYANNNLGLVFFKMKKLDSAQAYYTKALSLKPDMISALNNMGLVLSEKKDFDGAKKYFKTIVLNHPDNTQALTSLEYIFKQLNDPDSIIYYYKKSIDKGLRGTSVFNNMGRLYFESEKLDSAARWYYKAIDYDPGSATAYYNIGTVFMTLHQFDSAITFYKKALDIDPKYFNAELNMGIAYDNLNQLEPAVLHFKNAIGLNPRINQAYIYLAASYARNKKEEDALLYLKQGLEAGYNNYEYIVVDPDFDLLRKNPAFKALLKKYFPKKYKPEDD